MEFSQKKAADLSKSALEAAQKIKIQITAKISIFGEPNIESIVSTAETKAQNQIADLVELIDVHYTIRKINDKANFSGGMSGLMTDIARCELMIKTLQTHAKLLDSDSTASIYGRDDTVKADIPALTQRIRVALERVKNPESKAGGTDSITVDVIPESLKEQIQDQILLLRRQKANLSEQLAGLNINTKISLDDKTVSVLQKYKLL